LQPAREAPNHGAIRRRSTVAGKVKRASIN
jgi:hypothetical protein